MGKAIVLLPVMIIFGPLIILIIGFIFVVLKLISRSKASSWRGELIDKKHLQRREMDSNRLNDFYTLIFKTEGGKEIKVGVSREVFNQYQIGDRAEKPKGKLFPERLPKK
jgi:hypothetical protein